MHTSRLAAIPLKMWSAYNLKMPMVVNDTIRSAEANIPTRRPSAWGRLPSIDMVRGWALVIILLGHTDNILPNLNYHMAHNRISGTPPQLSGVYAYIGYVTDFAGPAFFLLMGLALALFIASRQQQGWGAGQITRYLLIRGAALVAVDTLIVNWDWTPNTGLYYSYRFLVLSSLGFSMWLLVLCHPLRNRLLLIGSVLLLLGIQMVYVTVPQPPETALYAAFIGGTNKALYVQYPVFAWFPIVLWGFVAGRLIVTRSITLEVFAWQAGLLCLIAWFVVSAGDSLGKLYHGHLLYMTRYPPDAVYLLFYAGATFWAIALHQRFVERLQAMGFFKFLILLGQTSLFFFVTHQIFARGLALFIERLPLPPLALSFLLTIATLVVLYIGCSAYNAVRRRYSNSILKYF